jgi:ATP-dependent helicase/DNAse subunit B
VDRLELVALKHRPEIDWGSLTSLVLGEEERLKELFLLLEEAHQAARLPARPEFWKQWYQGLTARFLDLNIDSMPDEEEEFHLRADGAALASFFVALAEVEQYCSLGKKEEITGGDFHRLMALAVGRRQYWVRDLRADVVNIVDPFEARQWELPVVFVCGLTQGEFPLLFNEDIFFTDQERVKLSRAGKASFKQTQERHGEERYLFYSAITRAKERLVLSYPGADSKGERNLPSPYLEQVRCLFSPADQAAMLAQRSLSRLLAEPEDAIDKEELVQAIGSGLASPKASEESALVSWLFQYCTSMGWLEVEPDHWQSGLRWDVAAPARAELGQSERFSVSQLLEFSQCPYRHFAGYILRLEEVSELGELGLEQRLAGIIVHQVLQRYYHLRKERDIIELLDEVFQAACRGLPISLTEVAAKEQMRASLSAFIDVEADREQGSCFKPFAFERVFGFGGVDPLVITDVAGGDILMQGKIDRLDVAQVNGCKLGLVIDYKYSKARGKSLKLEQVDDDNLLQLAVYMLALKRLPGFTPAGAFLYTLMDVKSSGLIHQDAWELLSPSENPPEGTISLTTEEFDQILSQGEERVAELVRQIRSGYIMVKPRDLRRCGPRGCPFSPVCRYEKWWDPQ